jgi:hypothetical protein
MRHAIQMLLLFFAVALALPVGAPPSLPLGTRWLEYLNKDLLPFWTTETAFGKPFGAFPSTRATIKRSTINKSPVQSCAADHCVSANRTYLSAMTPESQRVRFYKSGSLGS